MRAFKRGALTLAAVVGWVVILAQPASAHTVSGIGATNWKTVVTGVSPQVPGLTVTQVEDGSRVEITNHGPEVLILGYQGEPYLRVGPQGVFENRQSPSVYLNCSRTGCAVPPGLDVFGPPQWRKISSGQVVRYHDHRTHWMGTQLPPDIARAQGRVHVEASWHIMMVQGSTPITVSGYYVWIPGTSSVPWLLVAGALAAGGLALGVFAKWGAPLAAALVVLTINDIYHSIAIAGFWSGDLQYKVAQWFSGSWYSIVGWLLGLVGAWMLVRRKVDGLYAAVFAGGSALLFTGLLDNTVLSRSQVPFTASVAADRVTVVISLGLGLGVTLAALIGIRRSKPALPVTLDPATPVEAEPGLVEAGPVLGEEPGADLDADLDGVA